MKEKLIIGKVDKSDLPELDLFDIDIKIDSGAYTSSIHCHNIEKKTINGVDMVKFNILDESHPNYHEKEFVLKLCHEKIVKSSNGTSELRYVIKTKIILFEKEYDIELSLTDRIDMKYPILLGRKILKNNFIVDVSKNDLSYKQKNKHSNN